MATIKDITTKCKAGEISEAYDIAMQDLYNAPGNVWAQREVGWALYYLIKSDVESNNKEQLFEHLNVLQQLNMLTTANDSMIYENVLWKLAEFIKNLQPENLQSISELFDVIKNFSFVPSKPYSLLLQSALKFDGWNLMDEFIEWWNFDNLSSEDYQQFQMTNGKKLMSLAERTHIAYAKALLKQRELTKIEAYIPVIEELMESHPDMMYPGYFCGKLLLSLGAERQDALAKVIPFVKKKINEFWAWQLLSEIYKDDNVKELACLLRAVHCKTQEAFIGKVRIKLADKYLRQGDKARAKFHIDKVSKCYLEQGWRFPVDLQTLVSQPWLQTVQADGTDSIDYISITDDILYGECQECYAVISYLDLQSKRASLIYGMQKKTMTKFGSWKLRINEGDILKIKYTSDGDDIKVISATKADNNTELDYVKKVNGNIDKRDTNPFAFLRSSSLNCFVSPNLVQKKQLSNGDTVEAIIVYDFNKKKNEWNWSCLSINKI